MTSRNCSTSRKPISRRCWQDSSTEPAFAAGEVLERDRVITRGTQEGWQTDGDI